MTSCYLCLLHEISVPVYICPVFKHPYGLPAFEEEQPVDAVYSPSPKIMLLALWVKQCCHWFMCLDGDHISVGMWQGNSMTRDLTTPLLWCILPSIKGEARWLIQYRIFTGACEAAPNHSPHTLKQCWCGNTGNMFYPNNTHQNSIWGKTPRWKVKCWVPDGIQWLRKQDPQGLQGKGPSACAAWTQRGIYGSSQEGNEWEKKSERLERKMDLGPYMMRLPKRSLERRNQSLCLLCDMWCDNTHSVESCVFLWVGNVGGRLMRNQWRDHYEEQEYQITNLHPRGNRGHKNISPLGIHRNIEEGFGPPQAIDFICGFGLFIFLLRL